MKAGGLRAGLYLGFSLSGPGLSLNTPPPHCAAKLRKKCPEPDPRDTTNTRTPSQGQSLGTTPIPGPPPRAGA